jgi:transposase
VLAGRDPASAGDRVKTDARDALKLARLHAAGRRMSRSSWNFVAAVQFDE